VTDTATSTATSTVTTLDVRTPDGATSGTVDLPAEIFDVQVNIPLIHQVVVGQLAAARQGTHDTKTRGEVSGGGKKPYRQKGTGRARQGSIRAPQFAGGGVVHGPTPRSYDQRTPKKMKAAALRGALSDRAQNDRVHVVSGFVTGDVPSTKSAVAALASVVTSRNVLVVAERADALTWKSLRNVERVHLIAPDQLNTYDVLVSDDVVFTQGAYDAFVARVRGTGVTASSGDSSDGSSDDVAGEPATDAGTTKPAGAGASDEQLEAEVAGTTDPNLLAETANEAEGADVPAVNEVNEAAQEDGEGK
jgi:large subunit ribosomal protein L4